MTPTLALSDLLVALALEEDGAIARRTLCVTRQKGSQNPAATGAALAVSGDPPSEPTKPEAPGFARFLR
jgi:hypothetical protein